MVARRANGWGHRRTRLAAAGMALACALLLGACASGSSEQAATTSPASEAVGSLGWGSEALGSAGSDATEDPTYVNATYGFTFDPRFCEDLVMVSEARDAAVFTSEAWGMTLYVQGAENTEGYDEQALVDAISVQAAVPDGNPVVGEGYCVVQQLEHEDDADVVVTYTMFVGEGNYQGLICVFDPDIYETLTEEQGATLVAAFLPGDLTAVHSDLR